MKRHFRFWFALAGLAMLGGCAVPSERAEAESASAGAGQSGTAYLPPVAGSETELAQEAPVREARAAAPSWLRSSVSGTAPEVFAGSVMIVDAESGAQMFAKNADQPRPVASTQKLLTALLIAERGDLDRKVVVRPEDTRVEPTKLGLRSGETYTRRQLLTALLVKSCNDSAACLARDHSGSISAFAAAMNAKARQIGATHSHFENPHGLPTPGQYSTARDMARIACYAYREPALRQAMILRGVKFRHADGRLENLEATNRLLGVCPWVNGMKTGYTVASGRCLVTSAERGGKDVIIVQLGSNNRHIFGDATRLVYWALGESPFASAGQPWRPGTALN